MDGDFEKINETLIEATFFIDENPLIGDNVYMVRSQRLDSSMVASYYTYSNGVMNTTFFEEPDVDGDGFTVSEDCDDNNPNVNPDQIEMPYNGIDDDCNMATLDDDLDEDGFVLAEDCDDTNSEINPAGTEIPNNNIDEDCDGMDLTTTNVFYANQILVNIFPNPTAQFLYIDTEELEQFEFGLFDLIGKEWSIKMLSLIHI